MMASGGKNGPERTTGTVYLVVITLIHWSKTISENLPGIFFSFSFPNLNSFFFCQALFCVLSRGFMQTVLLRDLGEIGSLEEVGKVQNHLLASMGLDT